MSAPPAPSPVTVDRLLRDRARTTPDRVAVVASGSSWTYRELDRRSDEVAARLEPGSRVSTLTGNSLDHVALFFACAKAGAILHPISWRLAPAEIAFQLDDAEPAALIVEPELRALGEAALELARRPPVLGLDDRPASPAAHHTPGSDDPLLLIYTSGTTGKPKGALLTHANCFWTNLGFDLATGIGPADVVLQVLPQFHVGGWNVQPLLAWWKGARVVLERGFDAARALELIEREQVTTMMGVPANYLLMAGEPGFADADLTSLRLAVVGGAPMPVALLDVWAERGVEIVQGYGLTEAAPNVLCLQPEHARRKAGSAGRPYPYVECRLSDQGEILVRGPNVFAGYWRNPEATAAAFSDGWLLTGDLAVRDDEGDYWIRGRLKDLVVSGGENVYPAEIEAVLESHPAVVEAAVVGVPDERWGEVCAAFVVSEGPLSEAELQELCRERLARFKVPKTFQFVERLPRNSLGKVVKSELAGAPGAFLGKVAP